MCSWKEVGKQLRGQTGLPIASHSGRTLPATLPGAGEQTSKGGPWREMTLAKPHHMSRACVHDISVRNFNSPLCNVAQKVIFGDGLKTPRQSSAESFYPERSHVYGSRAFQSRIVNRNSLLGTSASLGKDPKFGSVLPAYAFLAWAIRSVPACAGSVHLPSLLRTPDPELDCGGWPPVLVPRKTHSDSLLSPFSLCSNIFLGLWHVPTLEN